MGASTLVQNAGCLTDRNSGKKRVGVREEHQYPPATINSTSRFGYETTNSIPIDQQRASRHISFRASLSSVYLRALDQKTSSVFSSMLSTRVDT